MAALPYMPLYIADYLSDAAHLTTLEHGAYLLLIMAYWQRGEALPNDDKKLARICRMTPGQWTRIKPQILEFFDEAGKQLCHLRIEHELAKVRAKSLNKRKGGLARAKQMHNKCSAPAKLIEDTDTDIQLDKSNCPDGPSDKAFWDNASSFIGGKRSLIGKWIKDHGREATAIAITTAQLERAADPVSYITATLRKRAKPQVKVGI